MKRVMLPYHTFGSGGSCLVRALIVAQDELWFAAFYRSAAITVRCGRHDELAADQGR